jgi:hypothetical protein
LREEGEKGCKPAWCQRRSESDAGRDEKARRSLRTEARCTAREDEREGIRFRRECKREVGVPGSS